MLKTDLLKETRLLPYGNRRHDLESAYRVLYRVLAHGAVRTAATGGGALLLPGLHLRSEGKWLRWLRLNPPKMAPFLAAPNTMS